MRSGTFAPGAYKLKVTAAGAPNTVLATSALQTLAAFEDNVEVVVEPEGASAKFYEAKEDH